jgi:hypothetical protein
MATAAARSVAPGLDSSTAGMALYPTGLNPIASITIDIVLAVNCAPQAPGTGQAASSIRRRSSSDNVPAEWAPMASNTSPAVMLRPSSVPGRMVPPNRITRGRCSRARAMAAADTVLSHKTMQARASNMWPPETSSIESAISSWLTSEAFIPSAPMVTVADGDRAVLHGRTARAAEPDLGVLGQPPVVGVARHRLGPGVGHPNDGPLPGRLVSTTLPSRTNP